MLFLKDGSARAKVKLILAHGAGAAMDSDFMTGLAQSIAGDDIEVIRFEFPYMADRRRDGKKRPPARAPKLLAFFSDVVDEVKKDARILMIGGKSMGGRMASLLVAERQVPVDGVVCLGYPFHPAGKPMNLRLENLSDAPCPTLIVQGTRDVLGTYEEVMQYQLGQQVHVEWLEDGNHDLKPRQKSGFTYEDHLAQAAVLVRDFCLSKC